MSMQSSKAAKSPQKQFQDMISNIKTLFQLSSGQFRKLKLQQ